jgi:hypothetical protein
MVRSPAVGAVSFRIVSHPTLGQPPRSLQAGFPAAADRLRAQRSSLAARALEVVVDADPSIRRRYDDTRLRGLLADAAVLVDRLALCVAGDDSYFLADFADSSATVFRRRKVAVMDVIHVLEGVRDASRGVLNEAEMASADRAVDAAVKVYRRFHDIRGDAREWNPITSKLYKGI